MDKLRSRLPFCLDFVGCKLLNLLYLFVSLDSVILKDLVMLTDKTRHSLECCARHDFGPSAGKPAHSKEALT